MTNGSLFGSWPRMPAGVVELGEDDGKIYAKLPNKLKHAGKEMLEVVDVAPSGDGFGRVAAEVN